jgi:SAM-dependent methyltransferase
MISKEFWEDKWVTQSTGWDIGYPSPAIVSFMESYPNKSAKILIPGCGNAYEAEWLLNNGFTDITLIDISPTLVDKLRDKYDENKHITIVCDDFFHLTQKFDLIIEQTFFCALNPLLRKEYVDKMHEILNEKGLLIGLLFSKEFEKEGPPYGGIQSEYHALFESKFQILKMEDCRNSILPRKDTELFIELEKK